MTQSDPLLLPPSASLIRANVCAALAEDVGDGDITAALIPESQMARGRVITRQAGVLCQVSDCVQVSG